MEKTVVFFEMCRKTYGFCRFSHSTRTYNVLYYIKLGPNITYKLDREVQLYWSAYYRYACEREVYVCVCGWPCVRLAV